MRLTAVQKEFRARVISDHALVPPEHDAQRDLGLNLQSRPDRLIESLRNAYRKTCRWVGDESFDAAAAHHLILHPPVSWALDDAGAGFSETLFSLFPNDPEVEELAWLEWQLQRVFVAADMSMLDASDFAGHTAAFKDDDWMGMRLVFTPVLAVRDMQTACVDIWQAIARSEALPDSVMLEEPVSVLVWREGVKPRFRQLGREEQLALEMMVGGGTFGALSDSLVGTYGAAGAVDRAGAMLGRWIRDGLILSLA